MSVDPIASLALPIDAYAYPNALSAEALLTYCKSQLSSLDTTVQSYLDDARLNVQRKKALSEVENMMKKYENQPPAQEQWHHYGEVFQGAIDSLPAGDRTRAQLEQKWAELHKKNGHFTKEEWKSETGKVGAMLQEVVGNAEINMIHLQSIMSQRQTAVQLTTGMLAKFDEATKSIVGNIGR